MGGRNSKEKFDETAKESKRAQKEVRRNRVYVTQMRGGRAATKQGVEIRNVRTSTQVLKKTSAARYRVVSSTSRKNSGKRGSRQAERGAQRVT